MYYFNYLDSWYNVYNNKQITFQLQSTYTNEFQVLIWAKKYIFPFTRSIVKNP